MGLLFICAKSLIMVFMSCCGCNCTNISPFIRCGFCADRFVVKTQRIATNRICAFFIVVICKNMVKEFFFVFVGMQICFVM